MKICKFLTFLAMLFLTGCGTLDIGIERKPNSTATTIALPTDAPSLTAAVEQPSPTVAYVIPTDTIPLPTVTPVAPTPTSGPQMVQIYLIALDDNGQSGPLVGCGDSAVPVQIETPPTQEVLRVSMEKLLSLKDALSLKG